MNDQDIENTKAKVLSLLKEFSTAMLITRNTEDRLHARPMMVADVQNSARLTFLTDINSMKTEELNRDARVALTFQSGQAFVAVTGRGHVVRDAERAHELWSEMNRAWFDGPEDPRIGILDVDLETAEYWDNTGTNLLRFVASAIKSAVSSARPDVTLDQHGTVTLR